MENKELILDHKKSSDNDFLPAHDSIAFTKLQTHLSAKSGSWRFNFRPLARAQIVNVREMSGYVAHLWTLGECRWTSEHSAPCYDDDESLPNGSVGNIWQDYHFDRPTETLLQNARYRHIVRDLQETQHRGRCSKCKGLGEIQCSTCAGNSHLDCDECYGQGEIQCCQDESCRKCIGQQSYVCAKCSGDGKDDCSACLTDGRVQCPVCDGCRFLVFWTRLHVKWYNRNSSMTYQPGESTILSSSKIKKASGKVTCLVFDNDWCSSAQSIDNVLHTCVDLPPEFQIKISEQYRTQHYMTSEKILRLHCVIERLRIKEIDYTFDEKADQIFTFCLYGEDETNVYDNQYPHKSYGHQCRCSCTLI